MALASLAGRRWGLKVSGWVATFPIVAGPILFFFALEQGEVFAAKAAQQTLLGLIVLNFFIQVYAWTSRRLDVPASILISWASFLIAAFLISHIELSLGWDLALVLLVINLSRLLLPVPKTMKEKKSGEKSVWDLPLRMTATALLVLGLTAMAKNFGPELSGVLTPFPVASTVLAGFGHYHHGSDGVSRLFRGFVAGMNAFALFCAALSFTLVSLGIGWSFLISLLVCLLAQAVIFKMSPPK